MSDSDGVLRRISWRDLCPWLVIFRTFRLAVSLGVLSLGTVGALLTPLGWLCARHVFLSEDTLRSDLPLHVIADRHARIPIEPPRQGLSFWPPAAVADSVPNLSDTFRSLIDPYVQLLSLQRLTLSKLAFLVAGALWTLLIWSVLGGAITRIAVVQLGREEAVGMVAAIRFALRRIRSYFIAPLFPLAGVVILCIPGVLGGLLMRTDAGVLIVGVLWILLVIAGLGITVLLLGLLFGWPLMWGAISAEEEGDEFEALHRSYSYTFQRPLHYVFYAALALVFGILGSLLVIAFAESVIHFTDWAVSWGSGYDRIHQIGIGSGEMPTPSAAAAMMTDEHSQVFQWGVTAIHWSRGFVRSVAAGFQFGFFWCAASALYLLMRRDVDHTEFDEVFLEQDRPQYTLPTIRPPSGPPANSAKTETEPSAPPDGTTAGEPTSGEV